MSNAALRPSDAGRWFYCPGSVRMQALFPSEPSESTVEGEAVHWIGSEVLLGRGGSPFLDRTAPNGVVIDNDDMVGGAMMYVEQIDRVVSEPGTVGVVVEEQLPPIKRIHSQCFGTPDAWYYDQVLKILHVFDLKYGFVIVEPKENKQELIYAIGALEELSKKLGVPVGTLDQELTVQLHIIQPRAAHRMGPVRTWAATGDSLRSWANRLEAAANRALADNPECISGTHCANCDALHACEAAERAGFNAMEIAGASTPHLLEVKQAVSEYMELKRAEAAIKTRLNAREGNLIAKIQAGEWVPGLVLDRGAGRLVWTRPVPEVIALGDALKKDLRAAPSVLTPVKARQKGIPAEVLAAYSAPSGSSLKLMPAEKSFAAQAFGRGL